MENWFYENEDLQDWEVSDFLEDVMSAEFNLQIEDGSLVDVSRSICQFFEICSKSNDDVIRAKLSTIPRSDASTLKVKVQKDVDDEDSGEEQTDSVNRDTVDRSSEKPLIDEDGFQSVKTKKKKKK